MSNSSNNNNKKTPLATSIMFAHLCKILRIAKLIDFYLFDDFFFAIYISIMYVFSVRLICIWHR
jgi:hypothetical protein